MKKHKWIFQIGLTMALYVLLIFAANKCAAEKDAYDVIGVGCVINNTPITMMVTSETVVTVDEATDIVTIFVSESQIHMYLLTDLVGRNSDSTYLGATFAAVSPDAKKYFINMQMFTDKTIQLTITDNEARTAFVLLLETPEEHEGVQVRQDTLRRRIIHSVNR